MISPDEANELIEEKIEDTDNVKFSDLTRDHVVELMRQACALESARNADSGTARGVAHAINALARHRDNLLEGNADADTFDIQSLDREEIEANFMHLAIQKIKTS